MAYYFNESYKSGTLVWPAAYFFAISKNWLNIEIKTEKNNNVFAATYGTLRGLMLCVCLFVYF